MKNSPGAPKLFTLAALLLFVSLGLMAVEEKVLLGLNDGFTEDQTGQQEPSARSPEKHSEGQFQTPQEVASEGTPERPNIIFILTDDQAARSISEMPNVQSLLVDQGTQFENFFTTTPRCCPSRAAFLRGQYAHNSGIRGNALPLGGFQKFRRSGKDRSTVATWLDDVGYDTVYLGKYLNNYDDTTYVPPGWATTTAPKSTGSTRTAVSPHTKETGYTTRICSATGPSGLSRAKQTTKIPSSCTSRRTPPTNRPT